MKECGNEHVQANTQVNAVDLHAMRGRIDELLASPLVSPSVARTIVRGKSPLSTSFERYMSKVLVDAGGDEFARIAVRTGLQLIPPGEGHLAQIVPANALSADDNQVVTAVQDAINRLCGLVDVLEDSADLPVPTLTGKMNGSAARGKLKITMSPLGGAFKCERPLYRSANVPIPPIGPNEQPSLAFLAEVDWRALEHVAVVARTVFQSSLLPNMYQGFMGAYAPPGSDWDVRTRLATTLNRLELPLQCDCRFDCDIPATTVALRFTVPSEASLPQPSHDAQSGITAETRDMASKGRLAYALRLACLLAAACFGAGRRIEQVILFAMDDGSHFFDCRFNRHDYVHHALASVEDRSLFDPALRFDPQGIIELMQPEGIEFASAAQCQHDVQHHEMSSDAKSLRLPQNSARTGSHEDARTSSDTLTKACSELETSEAGTRGSFTNTSRICPHEDTRALPTELAHLFHAGRICDIDTRHFHGKGEGVIQDARLDSNDSLLAAIAQLEHTIQSLEQDCVPPNDDANARPLFCSNPLSRAVVTLLDDDLAVSAEAQDFLNGSTRLHGQDAAQGPDRSGRTAGDANPGNRSKTASNAETPRYFRAPSALFQAHVGLSDLYAQLGDYRGAEAEADRCLTLAPTTAQAYYLKANALAQQERFAEAANTLSAGLSVAVSERDCALLYYHLGLVLWKMGRAQDAASVHVYAMSLAGEHAEKSAAIVRNLRKRKDVPVIVHASPLAATREMKRARIPLAPSDEAKTLVIQAAVGLSCANAPEAAAPYAAALTRYFRDDPIIKATAASLRHPLFHE